MSQLHSIYQELNRIKFRLKKTANRLWKIKLALVESYQTGFEERDFLPRRLLKLKEEQQLKFEKLTHQLSLIIGNCFHKKFIIFNSAEDVESILKIRKTVQYMKNAFASEPFLIQTLDRLNKVLSVQKI